MEGDTICNAANLLRRAVVETVGDPAEPRPGETSDSTCFYPLIFFAYFWTEN